MLELTEQEKKWLVYETRIVNEVYFESEEEAREYVKKRPGCSIEPPVKEIGKT
jgi:hypothetical protein